MVAIRGDNETRNSPGEPAGVIWFWKNHTLQSVSIRRRQAQTGKSRRGRLLTARLHNSIDRLHSVAG